VIKILLPIDGSEASLDAVRHALALAAAGLHTQLVLVNVQEPASLYEVVTASADPEALERVAQAAGHHALKAAEDLVKVTGTPFESEVVSGDPASELADAAERHDCDAVVLGARGVGIVRAAVMGSVSQSLLHRLAIPVTVVRHADFEPSAYLDDEAIDEVAED
jgi:nucleotide-binding universal stress UspA family protein